MGWFRRKPAATKGRPASGLWTGAVSVSRAKESGTATLAPPDPEEPATGPEIYTGTVVEPEATAAFRISSAADVDPNVKKYGEAGVFKGGGGGYGGAGTR
jgi:hypothetical protein